jgi:dihydropyrimidinase
MPFAYQQKGASLRAAVEEYRARARDKAATDYAIHLVVSDPTPQVVGQELPALINDGYTSFKIYLTYDSLKLDDREVLEVLAVARRERAMVMVHAENHEAIGWLTERLELAGHTAIRHLATSRPMPVEREATHRAISLAELVDVPILIVHVSGRDAVEQIKWAQGRGLRVFAETCPQYLFLSEDDLTVDGFEAAKYMCCPPPRDKANQEALWQALAAGVFQVFSSDHAPYRFDAADGKQLHGTEAGFGKVPPGVPGLETRLPLLFSEGVGKGRIDLNQFVALTATTPAKLYGLYPRKGTIAIGADADIAVWDADREVTISNALLHHAVDYTPYEGMTVRGWPVTTISRGEVVWRDDQVLARPGRGRFLPCDKPALAAPRGRTVLPQGII